MKPVLMVALAGFLLGITGGAGFGFVKKTRPGASVHPLADSLTAMAARSDSPAVPADSGAAVAPLAHAAGTAPAPAPAESAAETPSADRSAAEAAPETEAAPVAAPPRSEMEPKRLAKLFGQMQPREAARVMAQMSDPEIQMILALLGDRQASGILGSLPPERAAAVSRLVFGTHERTYQ